MGKNYVDIENDHGETLRYRKHSNGRGLIAHGAKVHPTAVIEAASGRIPSRVLLRLAAGALALAGLGLLALERRATRRTRTDVAPHAMTT